MRLIEHKNELVAAIIGALVGGLLSFAAGLYSLNKTFQMSQSKELLLGLRMDIWTLKNADREIDENIKLLLSNSYQIKAEFEPMEFKGPPIGRKKEDQDFAKWFKEYMQTVVGKQFVVKSLLVPSEKFVLGSWPTNLSSSSDIDFELVQALNDLNRKLMRVNGFLEQLSRLAPGETVDEATKKALERDIPQFNTAIAEITQSKLVQIKNRITEEIKKLQKRRDEISL